MKQIDHLHLKNLKLLMNPQYLKYRKKQNYLKSLK
jgi:hypothetical protein